MALTEVWTARSEVLFLCAQMGGHFVSSKEAQGCGISQVRGLQTTLLCIGASCPVLPLQGQDSPMATLVDLLLPYCRNQLVYTKIYNKNKTICSVNYSEKLRMS